MRTTLDLPESLVAEAMRLSGAHTKTGVITVALQELVRRIRIQGLKDYRGQVDLDLDLDALRKRG